MYEADIQLDEPLFTHGEAVEITGVPSKSLSQWAQRGVVELGVMHRTGRRLFSMLDLVELKVIGDLIALLQVPVNAAAAFASKARERAIARCERDGSGTPLFLRIGPEQRQYCFAWVRDGVHKVSVEEGTAWLAEHSWPHPLVVVPLDDLISHIQKKAVAVLDRESR